MQKDGWISSVMQYRAPILVQRLLYTALFALPAAMLFFLCRDIQRLCLGDTPFAAGGYIFFLSLWGLLLITALFVAEPKKIADGFTKTAVFSYPFIVLFLSELVWRENWVTTIRYFLIDRYYLSVILFLFLSGIFWFMNFIWRRIWISAAVLGATLMLMSYINLMKLEIINIPFLPWDIYFVGNLGEVTGFAGGGLRFPFHLGLSLGILAAFVILFALTKQRSFKNLYGRCIGGIGLAILSFLVIAVPSVKGKLYGDNQVTKGAQYVQKTSYEQNGFLGAFLFNIEGLKSDPEGYNKAAVEAILNKFSASEGSLQDNVDVVVILSETLFDMTKIEQLNFTVDPYKNLHKIQKNNYYGTMLQPNVGGGTVRVEYEVLTGTNLIERQEGTLPYNTFVASSAKTVNGLPTYFKNLGYRTVAIHSYLRDFYSRSSAYPKMGFDTYIGEEDMENAERTPTEGEYVSDHYFVEVIKQQLEKDPDTPTFLFGISMENHGPYDEKYESGSYDMIATHENLTQWQIRLVNQYLQGVRQADAAIGELYEWVKNREKPTVVLLFGDHPPSLGVGFGILQKSGLVSSSDSAQWSDRETYDAYGTPFVMFSNYLDGKGNLGTYSAYYLNTLLLDYIGAPYNEYWASVRAMRERLPIHNQLLMMNAQGEFITNDQLDLETKTMLAEYMTLCYDGTEGKRYTNDYLKTR